MMLDRVRTHRRSTLVSVAVTVVTLSTYLPYPALNHGPQRMYLETGVDRAMPLVPIMVIPYVSLIPLVFVTAVMCGLRGARSYQAYGLTLVLAMLASYAFYLFAQTYVPRPSVHGGGVLKDWLRDVYSADHPYNDFPSLHTSMATIIAASWLRAHRWTGYAVAVWCAAIIASTMLIHQHFIADVGGGVVVAVGALAGAERLVGVGGSSRSRAWLS
jgi:membrane-associated phospholipid phosphatase